MHDLWVWVAPKLGVLAIAAMVGGFASWARENRRRESMTPPTRGRICYHDGPWFLLGAYSNPDFAVDDLLASAKRLANARGYIPNPEKQT